jgi:hypothetical protein
VRVPLPGVIDLPDLIVRRVADKALGDVARTLF